MAPSTSRTRSWRDQILQYLAAGVTAAKKRFDPETGRFLAEGGGWAVTMQDVVLPLALLYTADVPANRLHGRKALLTLASRAGDALRDWQDSDGRFEFVKTDGSKWGKTYMPWSMYHWLEAYALLRDHLDPKRRRRWETGLRLAFRGSAREQQANRRIHNIPTWHAMALVRAGQAFGVPDWMDLGVEKCRVAAQHQHRDGYWPEGAGPTNSYNRVYVHALGLYHRFTGDEAVLPCLKRAIDFHRHFTYPDGTLVETVDGRVRYHATVSAMGLPGFGVTPEGWGLVRFLVQRMRERSPHGELSPHLASAWQYVPDGPATAPLQTRREYVALYPPRRPRALVRRQGPWFLCLSGYLTPPREREANVGSRWIMDRAQHVSLWHRKVGLVVGGGNSKNDPDRSTFVVWSANCCRHVADSARLVSSRTGDGIVLRYGRTTGTLRVRLLSDTRAELAFSASGSPSASVTGAFSLPLAAGSTLTDSGGQTPSTVDPLRQWGRRWGDESTPPRWFQTDAFRVEVPAGSSVAWPTYPFNPYAIDGTAPPAQTTARVSTRLRAGAGTQRFLIRIRR